MNQTELTAVKPHRSDEYIDEQIKDLFKALEQTEVAIDKLQAGSKSKATHVARAPEAMPVSVNALRNR
jgi:hypothetical protein